MSVRLVERPPTCGKHGCVRDPEHEGPHRNRYWEWLEGKEGSSAKKLKQAGGTET